MNLLCLQCVQSPVSVSVLVRGKELEWGRAEKRGNWQKESSTIQALITSLK